jgi:hypothetical protein
MHAILVHTNVLAFLRRLVSAAAAGSLILAVAASNSEGDGRRGRHAKGAERKETASSRPTARYTAEAAPHLTQTELAWYDVTVDHHCTSCLKGGVSKVGVEGAEPVDMLNFHNGVQAQTGAPWAQVNVVRQLFPNVVTW